MADLTEEALDDGLTAQEILDGGLMAGMDYVGVEFKAGNMFVPEVLLSARAMRPMDTAAASAGSGGGQGRARSSSARSRVTCTTSARTWWR